MSFPVAPPVSPMLAKLARELPVAEGMVYEPKWDGFRCIVFRDGDEVELGSRNERPLTRYFPELLDPIRSQLPDRCVLDGEIVIAGSAGLDFDALLQRVHPAESRVRMLAETTPASFVAFDVLGLGDRDLRSEPFAERRRILEQSMADVEPPIYATPATTSPDVAMDWFSRFEGAGLDGVVAKRAEDPYKEGERIMVKVKHERTADCVVGGFRPHKQDGNVGSLLLGLYDDSGRLHHVGVCSAFTAQRRRGARRRARAVQAEPRPGHTLGSVPPEGTRMPGGQSRWTGGRDLSWEVLRPELVCEVAYDHLQGDRFRHATTFRRWRTDRTPESCTYAQLEAVAPAELSALFGSTERCLHSPINTERCGAVTRWISPKGCRARRPSWRGGSRRPRRKPPRPPGRPQELTTGTRSSVKPWSDEGVLHRPGEKRTDDHACNRTQQRHDHRLVAHHGSHLRARHAECAQEPELPRPFEHRESERVHDADEADQHGEHEDHRYQVDDLVDLVDRGRLKGGLVLDLRLRIPRESRRDRREHDVRVEPGRPADEHTGRRGLAETGRWVERGEQHPAEGVAGLKDGCDHERSPALRSRSSPRAAGRGANPRTQAPERRPPRSPTRAHRSSPAPGRG